MLLYERKQDVSPQVPQCCYKFKTLRTTSDNQPAGFTHSRSVTVLYLPFPYRKFSLVSSQWSSSNHLWLGTAQFQLMFAPSNKLLKFNK